MIVYRLTKAKYKNQLSGIGAELNGGRWNNKGIRIIYTSESRALCTSEIAVHTPLGIIPSNYFLQTINIPKCRIIKIEVNQLEKKWNRFPHVKSTKTIGDQFVIRNKFLLLKVPSAVIQDEYNYLINPFHDKFKRVKIEKIEEFKFDSRLFK